MVKTINCGGATLVYGFHSVCRGFALVLFVMLRNTCVWDVYVWRPIRD